MSILRTLTVWSLVSMAFCGSLFETLPLQFNSIEYTIEVDAQNSSNACDARLVLPPLLKINVSDIQCSTDLIFNISTMNLKIKLWNVQYKTAAITQFTRKTRCNRSLVSANIQKMRDVRPLWSVLPPNSSIYDMPVISGEFIKYSGQTQQIPVVFYPKNTYQCYKMKKYFQLPNSNIYNWFLIEFKKDNETKAAVYKLSNYAEYDVEAKIDLDLDYQTMKNEITVNETKKTVDALRTRIDNLFRTFHNFQNKAFTREKHERIVNSNRLSILEGKLSSEVCRNVTMPHNISTTKMGWLYLSVTCRPLEYLRHFSRHLAICCSLIFHA